MSNPIDAQTVRHIAKLARLKLREDEIQTFTGQLAAILDYVRQLESVDVTGVEPLEHPLAMMDVVRDDVVEPGLTPEQALSNAPRRQADFFIAPSVVDPGQGA